MPLSNPLRRQRAEDGGTAGDADTLEEEDSRSLARDPRVGSEERCWHGGRPMP
jgi:hypothetical protein